MKVLMKRGINIRGRYLLLCIIFIIICTSGITVLLYRSAQGVNIDCHFSLEPFHLPLSNSFEDTTRLNTIQDQLIIPQLTNDTKFLKPNQKRTISKNKVNLLHHNLNMSSPLPFPNYNIHIFYYAWYSNVEIDGHWKHWNHKYIPSWKKVDKVFPTGAHEPPSDIGSNFYPELGCYSSRDLHTIDTHMQQLKDIQVGVIVVSWYPSNTTDSEGSSSDGVFSKLLDSALKHGLRVAPHVEPYRGRNPINLAKHIRDFIKQYGDHPGLYRMQYRGKNLPVYYIYDSYQTPAGAWRELLSAKGNLSIRGTRYDGIFLGLLVEAQHRFDIRRAHFDGFYTYFATNGFSYGSSWKNWKGLNKFAIQNGLLFVPSVGPGYIDTQVRPWNSANTQHRRHGKYYEVAWRSALQSKAEIISITSFNEWHEGTQIEPAIPRSTALFTYLDYEPEGPHYYLNLTKFWVNIFSKKET